MGMIKSDSLKSRILHSKNLLSPNLSCFEYVPALLKNIPLSRRCFLMATPNVQVGLTLCREYSGNVIVLRRLLTLELQDLLVLHVPCNTSHTKLKHSSNDLAPSLP